MPQVAGETEVTDLTEFEFTPEVECDWEECQRAATGYIICAACGLSREAECPGHRSQGIAYSVIDPDWQIRFSTSCNHSPFYKDCAFEPLA